MSTLNIENPSPQDLQSVMSKPYPIFESSGRLTVSIAKLLEGNPRAIAPVVELLEGTEAKIRSGDLRGLAEVNQITLLNYRNLMKLAAEQCGDEPARTVLVELGLKVNQVLVEASKLERMSIRYVDFDELTAGLSEEQLTVIGRNLAFVQLSKGCSVACPNCNFNALVTPRSHLSWEAVTTILDRWAPFMARNFAVLYYASDPLDWRVVDRGGRERTYLDIDQYQREKFGYTMLVTTAVPRGSEEIAKKLWASDTAVRISPSDANFKRLGRAGFWSGENMYELGVSLGPPGNFRSMVYMEPDRHPGAPLSGEAGLSYDYEREVYSIACKSGTSITPDGVFNIDGTSTTPFTPNAGTLDRIESTTRHIFAYRTIVADSGGSPIYAPQLLEIPGDESKRISISASTLFDSTCRVLTSLVAHVREGGEKGFRMNEEDVTAGHQPFAYEHELQHYRDGCKKLAVSKLEEAEKRLGLMTIAQNRHPYYDLVLGTFKALTSCARSEHGIITSEADCSRARLLSRFVAPIFARSGHDFSANENVYDGVLAVSQLMENYRRPDMLRLPGMRAPDRHAFEAAFYLDRAFIFLNLGMTCHAIHDHTDPYAPRIAEKHQARTLLSLHQFFENKPEELDQILRVVWRTLSDGEYSRERFTSELSGYLSYVVPGTLEDGVLRAVLGGRAL